MPATAKPIASRREYRVYVIKLDPKVLDDPRFRKANPNHDPRKSCIYVGSTGIPAEERFIRHKSGIKANRYARDFGIGLMKSLTAGLKPEKTKIAAVRKEAAQARKRRRAGYAVWPSDAALQREIEKLEAKRREKRAERAERARQRRRSSARRRRPRLPGAGM